MKKQKHHEEPWEFRRGNIYGKYFNGVEIVAVPIGSWPSTRQHNAERTVACVFAFVFLIQQLVGLIREFME